MSRTIKPAHGVPRVASLVLVLLAGSAAGASAQTPTDPVTPGTLRSYSTIYSIGLEWDVTNDTDHDATATVEFRVSGTSTWRSALPLVRIDYNGYNRLAGSILFLSPNTQYEVRISLSDPDGGGETRTLTALRTRRVPVAPSGRVWHVVPGTGGGSGTIGDPFRGIATAQAAAGAGDTFLLHAGTYVGARQTDGTFLPVRFSIPGTSASYLAWKAAGDGEVLFGSGIEVAASHLWFEGVTVRNRTYGASTLHSPTNVVISRSGFFGNRNAIFLNNGGSNWYIADNVIVGDRPASGGSLGGEGIDLRTTSGHTVAHNSITNVADGISFPHTNVDIFGNDIFDVSDDGIEPDNGRSNVRIWGNRIHNAVHNGISFQPQIVGPWYIIRNQIVSNAEGALKFRTTDRFVLVHNTIVNWGTAWPGNAIMCCNEGHLLRAFARNNVWVSVQGGQIWGLDVTNPDDPNQPIPVLRDWRTDLDYDGFDWGESMEPFAYAGVTHPDLFSFATASGLETNGRRLSRWNTCFEDLRVTGPAPAAVPPHLVTLRAECEAVDAGAPLPNINEGFVGAGPDMGAHERGSPAAAYGPRPRVGTVPVSPSFLRAAPAGTRIDLQWTDNANDELGFRIERSTNGTTFAAHATLGADAIAYSDTAVTTGTTYYYRVAAYNEAGPSSYSNTAFAAVASNAPPTVRVTTPVTEATFTAPATIAITADASDGDGSVVRVDFLSGGTVIGTASMSPWSFTWTNVPAGAYAISARAIDNLNATAASAAVNVTVSASMGEREVVLHTRYASIRGGWMVTADTTAASGARLQNANASAARVEPPLASPTQYFEMSFNAEAGVGYRLWMRGKAIGDAWSNDSVWAQFDGSVTATGAAVYRIGTTSATRLALQPVTDVTLSGWGWEDNGYNGTGARIYFNRTGVQRIRIQVREDGLGIDQIVLSPERYLTAAPGATRNDTTRLPQATGVPAGVDEVVLHARYASTRGGWAVTTDNTAANGGLLQNPNANAAKVEPPLASPVRYFEMIFSADAGVGYRLWMRGRATGNSWSNDSVWAQFDGAITSTGAAVYRIGTTSATKLALQPVYNAPLSGWGWEDNGFSGMGPLIYFNRTGVQRLRIQVREDGLGIDQIVLSAERYRETAPGATTNDTVVVPRTQ